MPPPSASSSARASTSASASSPRSSPPRPRTPPISRTRRSSPPKSAPTRCAVARRGIDLYALTHNETSTGVMMPIRRPEGRRSPADGGGLVAVDATSGAGGLRVDPEQFDAYYFAPQKCFGSDGGLWVALLSPAARTGSTDHRLQALGPGLLGPDHRPRQLASSTRPTTPRPWPPSSCSTTRSTGSTSSGGLAFSAGRCDRSAEILYTWAEQLRLRHALRDPGAGRSHVVGTIDFDDAVDAATVATVLRANGDRGHRALPQAGPQPAPDRHVPGHRPRRRRLPVRLHQPRGGSPGRLKGPPLGPGAIVSLGRPVRRRRRPVATGGPRATPAGRSADRAAASAPRATSARRNDAGSSPHDRDRPSSTSSSTVPSGAGHKRPEGGRRGAARRGFRPGTCAPAAPHVTADHEDRHAGTEVPVRGG